MSKLIYSVSGGKDSAAMLCHAYELGIEIDEVVFADTTLEFPEIYDYLHTLEEYTGYKITRLQPFRDWEEWFYGIPARGKHKGIRGFPPELLPGCYIRRDAKVGPLAKHIGKGNTVALGFAIDEFRRSKSKAYRNTDNEYVFPLIQWGWTEKDCVRYLERIGIPHPLSGTFSRTGCWLCPKQPIDSLVALCRNYPDLWAKLKRLENDAPYPLKRDITLHEVEQLAEGKLRLAKLTDYMR